MENVSFFSTVFILFFLISTTIYSILIGFTSPKNELKDPFEKHEK